MSRFASYDGVLLSWTEVGTGPPLVCLPGGPGRAAAYLEDLGGLAEDRTLLLLDGRATGASEVPPDPATLRFDRLADDVAALRRHLGLGPLDLLGHSAGALVAQVYAARHPLSSLVLVTPTARLQGGTGSDLATVGAARSGEPWYPDAAEALAALATAPPAQQQALVRATRPFLYGRWDERTAAHAATADRQSSRRAELGFPGAPGEVDVAGILAGLSAVSAPVLVLGGERDALTGVDAVREVAASLPTARVAVLPGAGHFPWVDEPAAFRTAVREFLGTLRS